MGPNAGFRSRLMRAIHAEAAKRHIDHDSLRDICRDRCGVRSMQEMTGEQLYALYHQWTGKGLRKRAKSAAAGAEDHSQLISGEEMIELAQEFAKRGWGQQTQANFIRRQLHGRAVIRTRGEWRKVLHGVRAMNRRDTEKQ